MKQMLLSDKTEIAAAYDAMERVFAAGWRDDSDGRHISCASFSCLRGGDRILATVISTLTDPHKIAVERPEVELETTYYVFRKSGLPGFRIAAQKAIMLCEDSIPEQTLPILIGIADDAARLKSASVRPSDEYPEISAKIQSAYANYPNY